jgi:hypothetical protein
MVQSSEALTRGDNRSSLVSARRATWQEGYLAVAERAIPVNAIEQTWIFGAGEKTRVTRTTPRSVSTLAEIIDWLSHLGSGRIHDRCLESRHHIYDSLTINRIRF